MKFWILQELQTPYGRLLDEQVCVLLKEGKCVRVRSVGWRNACRDYAVRRASSGDRVVERGKQKTVLTGGLFTQAEINQLA